MRTLHLYLTRQILITLVMTAAVFTLVLLLGNLLKEILALVLNRQASLGLILKAIGLLLPYVMVFALPMGMLTATLLVFGRFSADQELTAVRASGISLLSMIGPILLLGVVTSCVCAMINLQIAPLCKVTYKNLLFQLGLERSAALMQNMEKRFVTEFPGYVFYAGKVRGANLQNVFFYQLEEGQTILSLTAPRARYYLDRTNHQILFQFMQASIAIRSEKIEGADTNSTSDLVSSNMIASATNPLQPTHSLAPLPGAVMSQESTAKADEPDPDKWRMLFAEEWGPIPIDFRPPAQRARKPKLSEMTFDQLLAERRQHLRQGINTTPVSVQLHRQVAFSFASLSFTLIGIPLGIRAHRRETNAGVSMALILLMIYYSFIITGEALDTRTEVFPHLLFWWPNFLFQSVGAWLLWRVNKG